MCLKIIYYSRCSPLKQQSHVILFQAAEDLELLQIAYVRFFVFAELDGANDRRPFQAERQELGRAIGV